MPDEGMPVRSALSSPRSAAPDVDDLLWPFRHNDPLIDLLLAEMVQAVRPRDFIERHFVSISAQLIWRYRTVSIYYERLLAQARDEGMEHLLAGPAMSRIKTPVETEINPSNRQAIEAILAKAGYDEEDVKARAFFVSLDEVERIERLLEGYRRELIKIQAAIARHRASLGRQVAEVVALATRETLT